MSFLTPLYLLGLAAIAFPIAFHFLRRTPSGRIPFSSLMFLKTSPPRMTRRSRLQHLPLLLLRALALCLLGAAFARPFLRDTAALELNQTGFQRVLVLLDTSASMRRDNLWAQAKQKLTEQLDNLGPADQFALWTFDSQVQPLMSFEEWTTTGESVAPQLTRQRVGELTPGWQSSHLGKALVAAADEVDRIESSTHQLSAAQVRRVVVISDLQQGSQLAELQGYQWPETVKLSVEQVRPTNPTNAGLQLLTDSTADADPQQLRIQVNNSADAVHEQFALGWQAEPTQESSGSRIEVYVPPGKSRTVIVPLSDNDGSTTSRLLTLYGDGHPFDNTLYIQRPKPLDQLVLYLGSETAVPDEATEAGSARFFLERAFPDSPRRTVRFRSPAEDDFPPDDWGKAALVVATSIDPDWVAPLKDYLRSGGMALIVAASTELEQPLRELVGSPSLTMEAGSAGEYTMLSSIDFQHPLFAPFADPRFNDFTKIHFWKYCQIKGQLPEAKTVASFDTGAPALVEFPLEKGKVLLLMSGWTTTDSQLALSSKFAPLLNRLLDLTSETGLQPQYFVGDKLTLPAGSAEAPVEVTLHSPDGKTQQISLGESVTLTQPGVYRWSLDGAEIAVAVNPRPEESDTAPLPLETLEALGVRLETGDRPTAEEAETDRRQLLASELESRQKLWRWLLVAALLTLAWETWLAHRWSPREDSEGEHHGPSD